MKQEIKDKVVRVKQHVKEHKEAYLVGTGCFIAGAVISRRTPIVAQVAKNNGVVVWKPQNTNIAVTNLTRRGHPGNLIKCVETGEVFASQNRAADALGINRTALHRFLKGAQPDVNGFTFEVLGEAK